MYDQDTKYENMMEISYDELRLILLSIVTVIFSINNFLISKSILL